MVSRRAHLGSALTMGVLPNVLFLARFKRTGKRNEIFLATKFAITGDPTRPINGDPEYVKKCMDRSLSRLGGLYATSSSLSGFLISQRHAVDFVDLFYMHRSVTPMNISTIPTWS